MLLKLTAKFSDDCKYSCPTASVNSASRANITEAPHTHKLSLPSPQWSLSLHLIPSDCQTHEQNTTLKNSHLGKHLPGKCPFFLNLTAAFHFFFQIAAPLYLSKGPCSPSFQMTQPCLHWGGTDCGEVRMVCMDIEIAQSQQCDFHSRMECMEQHSATLHFPLNTNKCKHSFILIRLPDTISYKLWTLHFYGSFNYYILTRYVYYYYY